MDQQTILFAILAVVAAGGLAFAFLEPLLSGEARAEKRQKAFVNIEATRSRRSDRLNEASRRKQVADTLKELDLRQSNLDKVTLEMRLVQAGLSWRRRQFYVFSGFMALATALILYLISQNPLLALGGLVVGGFGLPNWVIGVLKKRRINKFLNEFPNAIDVIVRGIKSGLPLGDCLRIIAAEAAEPVRTEFRTIVETQTLGVPIADACAKLRERVPVPESNFFGIVIQIQSKSGGNLSEVLGNLSKILRDRKKMKGKIQAMSMEAKASAAIIGSLPFCVGGLVYISAPKYIMFLFTTTTGKVAMICGAFWMLMGILTMRKMINFEI